MTDTDNTDSPGEPSLAPPLVQVPAQELIPAQVVSAQELIPAPPPPVKKNIGRPFVRGPENKGRPVGAVNKTTRDVRTAIAKVATGMAGEVEDWIRQIDDPARRVMCYLQLIEYHIPKLARTEVTGQDGQPLQVTVVRFSDG